MRHRGLVLALVIFGVLITVADQRAQAVFSWKYPAPTELAVTNDYLTDAGALLLGGHRLAADLAYIQMLQYYGTPESGHAGSEHHDHDGHDHGYDFAGGAYDKLLTFGRRIVRLDPFFHGSILEVSGALAFNVKRPDEALTLLREAIERDPSFHRYRIYTAAILYRNEGRYDDLIAMLQEAIKFPDCPPLLENVLGNLLKRYGHLTEAAEVYAHTVTTAVRPEDRRTAERNLIELVQENPQLASTVRQLLGN